MSDLAHVIGAGACWCGYSRKDFLAGGNTHPEQADLFEGIRRHAGRLDCGHVQPFLRAPEVGWGEWCQRCRDIRRVVLGCGCPRFEQVAAGG